MNCGDVAIIVEYTNINDIVVKFKNTGELINTSYDTFKKGSIKNYMTPSIYGVGIIGIENSYGNGIISRMPYIAWKNMLQRCYNISFQEKHKSYIDCTVSDEWLYYPNFEKWYNNNHYYIDGQKMCIDKDILNKDNKIYSSSTCLFVPNNINTLFIRQKKNRGNLPIGVYLDKRRNKYGAKCSTVDKIKHLGHYNNQESAFNAYKNFKENYIKETAEQYKQLIPEVLYNAMINYVVEITD